MILTYKIMSFECIPTDCLRNEIYGIRCYAK